MNDKRKNYPDLERSQERNHPKQLQTDNVSAKDEKNPD